MTLPIADTRKSDKWIPYYFIPFFAVVLIVNIIFISVALSSYTGVVSDASYENGLTYNQTRKEAEQENQFHLLQSASYTKGVLIWTLHLPNRAPIERATVKAHFIRAVQAGHDFDRDLTDTGNGVYMVEVLPPMAGAWTAKLEATWDNKQHYTTTYRFVSQ